MPINFRGLGGPAVFPSVATFDSLIRVKGSHYADVTHPLFGADPLGLVPSQAALKAAWDSLASGGTLRIPGGTYLCTDQVLWANNKDVKIETDGTSSKLVFTPSSPLTDGLRIVDAGRLSMNGLRVQNNGGSAITNLVTVTTTGSAEITAIRDLLIDPQTSGITNMLALAPDTSLDLAEILLENVSCAGVGCSNAALLLGNGTQGNVTNIRALGCLFAVGLYGVLCNGAMIELRDCTMQTNSGADIKVMQPGGSPLIVDGCRSENSKKFLENTQNNLIIGPVSFKNIHIAAFTNSNGHVVDWACVSSVDLENWTIWGGPVPGVLSFTCPLPSPQLASVTAKNILSTTKNPFIPSTNVDINWMAPRRYMDSSLFMNEIVPTPSALSAAGSGATASLAAGSDDLRGQVTVNVGTGPTAGGVVRVTYGSRIGNRNPRVTLTGISASAMIASAGIFLDTPDYFEIYMPTAPTASTAYVWNYEVGW